MIIGRVPLKRLARIAASNVDKKSVEGEHPIDLCNYTDVYYHDEILNDLEFMKATATHEQISAFSLRAGDVLITKDSETREDIGIPAFVPRYLENVLCGYHLSILRPNQNVVDSKFLFWSLKSESAKSHFARLAKGVTRFAIGYEEIGSLAIRVPPLEEQVRIARFLDAATNEIGLLAKSCG